MRVTWSIGILALLVLSVVAVPAQATASQEAFYRVKEDVQPPKDCRIWTLPIPGTDCKVEGDGAKTYDPVGQFSFTSTGSTKVTLKLEDTSGQGVLFKVAYDGVSKVCVGTCTVSASSVQVFIDPVFFSAYDLATHAGFPLPTSGVIKAQFA